MSGIVGDARILDFMNEIYSNIKISSYECNDLKKLGIVYDEEEEEYVWGDVSVDDEDNYEEEEEENREIIEKLSEDKKQE